MTGIDHATVDHSETDKGGCVRALLAAPALVFLAPMAALYRSWARWRRGSAVLVNSGIAGFERSPGAWAKVTATVDIPHTADNAQLMTRCLVRLAERLGTDAQAYHLIHREPGCEETIAVPLGLTINDLAERFSLSCRRSILDRKTLLWLAWLRGSHLGEYIDPVTYDPEAAGEPERLLRAAPFAWALALNRRRGSASTVFHLEFIVAREKADAVEAALDRLSRAP